VNRVRQCPSDDLKNIDCGFLPSDRWPSQGPPGVWSQSGIVYRTPAFGGFKPFVISTFSKDRRDAGSFVIKIEENPRLG
jgi:hypothetical protein